MYGLPVRFFGVFEDNDPNAAAHDGGRQLQQRHRRVLGVLGHRLVYPVDLTNEAYKFGVNYVMYALTH